MSKKPYYTSTELIAAVKRKMSFPITQVTYSEDDILEFATEELFMSQVPSVMQYHEEYFVFNDEVALENGVQRYDLPTRAIGMKLRDLFYKDTNNNLLEMSNVGVGNTDLYKTNSFGYSYPKYYTVEGNEIVLMPDVQSVTGSLVMKYYLRPNSLVTNDRAGISNSFVKIVTVDNSVLVAGDTLSVGASVLTADTSFVIGATSTATAANIATAINAISGLTATSTGSDVSIFYSNRSRTFESSNSSALIVDELIGIRCDSVPTHFEDGMLIDFLQTEGGHNTLAFDIEVPEDGVSSDTVFFNASDVPEKFVIGDYICEQYECIIPQIPSDLHTLLAERTCMRIMEALGDQQGVQTQTAKVTDLEARQAVMVSNRTEGSPKKLSNRHSLLRYGKTRRIRRGIF